MRAVPKAANAWPFDDRACGPASPQSARWVQPLLVTSLRSREVFERALQKPALARSHHFALHRWTEPLVAVDLSTTSGQPRKPPVDNLIETAALGLVIPKRHAQRAVTRNALKRQVRLVVARHAASLLPGAWVVRLKAPFDRKVFTAATSSALKLAARQELEGLLSSALARAAKPLATA